MRVQSEVVPPPVFLDSCALECLLVVTNAGSSGDFADGKVRTVKEFLTGIPPCPTRASGLIAVGHSNGINIRM